MARVLSLTPAERELVTMAVSDAEQGTDAEIVTIVAARSDQYADVALHYAVLAVLIATAKAAIWPWALIWWSDPMATGWEATPSLSRLFFTLLIGQAIGFLIVRYALEYRPLRLLLTPRGTKARRVRRRATELFKVGAEKRTKARIGILIYLSLDERIAEIVADEAIHAKVPNERWGDAMAALIEHVRAGKPGEGMAAAIGQIGRIVAEHFPKTAGDENELPDRLIEL